MNYEYPSLKHQADTSHHVPETKYMSQAQRMAQSFLDRTMPKNQHEAKIRRRVIKIGAGLLVTVASLAALNHMHNATDDESKKPEFNPDPSITSIKLYSNPENPDLSSIIRTSPDTGVLGMTNRIGAIPSILGEIQTPEGVEKICNGEVYVNLVGNEEERCWLGLSLSDIQSSISQNPAAVRGMNPDELANLMGLSSEQEVVFIADDLADASTKQ